MSDKLYLGVDIGGTAAKLGLVDEEGRIISSVNSYYRNSGKECETFYG